MLFPIIQNTQPQKKFQLHTLTLRISLSNVSDTMVDVQGTAVGEGDRQKYGQNSRMLRNSQNSYTQTESWIVIGFIHINTSRFHANNVINILGLLDCHPTLPTPQQLICTQIQAGHCPRTRSAPIARTLPGSAYLAQDPAFRLTRLNARRVAVNAL